MRNAIKKVFNNININAAMFTLLYMVYKTIYPVTSVREGLDPSWKLGLNLAEIRGFQWGKDIAFTYGPLYYITGIVGEVQSPSNIIIKCLIVNLLSLISIYIVCGIFFNNINKTISLRIISICGILICFFMDITLPDLMIVCCLIIIYKIIISKISMSILKYKMLIFLNSLMLATLTLYKFSYVALSISLFFIMILVFLYNKKLTNIMDSIGSYLIFVILFWIIMGQNIKYLLNYFIYGFSISKGYSEAMQIFNKDQTFNLYYFGLLVLIIFSLICFCYLIKKQYNQFLSVLIILPVIFLSFKEGFVRDDGHYYSFFAQLIALMMYVLYLSIENIKYISYIKICGLIAIIFISFSIVKPSYLPQFNWYNFSEYSSNNRNSTIENSKNKLKNDYKLNNDFKTHIKGDKSIDIIPWDVSLLYAYDYKWSPRPVFQSYAAYTSELDKLNSEHFTGSKSPEQILYTYKSIDKRYPIFDEPAVFQKLITNYKVVERQGNEWLLLNKKEKSTSTNLNVVLKEDIKLNEIVTVPKIKNNHLFCKIDIKLNIFGKIVNFFYKVTPLNIDFYINGNSQPVSMRMIRDTGKDGLFISKFAENTLDVEDIFNENYIQNIDKIAINGKSLFYNKNISIEFLSMPFINKLSDSDNMETDSKIKFNVDNFNYANGSINAAGWCFDEINKKEIVNPVFVFENVKTEKQSIFPVKKCYRPDVADNFKIAEIDNSGWSCNISDTFLDNSEYDIYFKCYDYSKSKVYQQKISNINVEK